MHTSISKWQKSQDEQSTVNAYIDIKAFHIHWNNHKPYQIYYYQHDNQKAQVLSWQSEKHKSNTVNTYINTKNNFTHIHLLYKCTQTPAHSLTPSQAHKRVRTHSPMHTRTHAHSKTHTHTHTHKHTRPADETVAATAGSPVSPMLCSAPPPPPPPPPLHQPMPKVTIYSMSALITCMWHLMTISIRKWSSTHTHIHTLTHSLTESFYFFLLNSHLSFTWILVENESSKYWIKNISHKHVISRQKKGVRRHKGLNS